jgi:hypothetical protein
MWFELRGTEAVTLELRATIAADEARRLVRASPLALEVVQGERVVVDLLLFDMRDLTMCGLPRPRFNYGEALWRVGVVHRGAPSWFATCCDIDRAWVRWTSPLMVRYPIRRAAFSFKTGEGATEQGTWTARVDARPGSLSVEARLSDEAPEAEPPRPLLVRSGGRLFRIPWVEEPAPMRRRADVSVSGELGVATFGRTLRWETSALAHRGRVHRCGLARPLGQEHAGPVAAPPIVAKPGALSSQRDGEL